MPLPAFIVTGVAVAKAAHAWSQTPQGKAAIGTVITGISAVKAWRSTTVQERDDATKLQHKGLKQLSEGGGQMLGQFAADLMKKRRRAAMRGTIWG